MKEMQILNLFSGLGGNRTLWKDDVTAVERDPQIAKLYQERFPDDMVIVGDTFDYLRNKEIQLNTYDFIWASPPCPTHSQMQKFNKSTVQRSPIPRLDEIYGLLIWLELHFNFHYVIENVQPYYITPIKPSVSIDRHLFWSNFRIKKTTFRENEWKHGAIGGIMRYRKGVLIKMLGLEDIEEELYKLPHHEKIIRNTISPEIGKYVLDQLKSKTSLLRFLTP